MPLEKMKLADFLEKKRAQIVWCPDDLLKVVTEEAKKSKEKVI